MQARGLLMIEHRLIERMISVIKDVLMQIESTQEVDPVFVDTAVDFIRTYADRTHHGKEEDILFRDLSKRVLSAEDQKVMKELIEEQTSADVKKYLSLLYSAASNILSPFGYSPKEVYDYVRGFQRTKLTSF